MSNNIEHPKTGYKSLADELIGDNAFSLPHSDEFRAKLDVADKVATAIAAYLEAKRGVKVEYGELSDAKSIYADIVSDDVKMRLRVCVYYNSPDISITLDSRIRVIHQMKMFLAYYLLWANSKLKYCSWLIDDISNTVYCRYRYKYKSNTVKRKAISISDVTEQFSLHFDEIYREAINRHTDICHYSSGKIVDPEFKQTTLKYLKSFISELTK